MTFSRVVATASHGDGSTSVGYIDLATGAFTDVTQPKSSSFSSTAHHDENPLFAPDENSLWFDRILPLPTNPNAPAHHVSVFSVALPNGSPVEVGQSGGAAVPNFWAVAPRHHVVGTGLVLPNPSATVAVADEQALGSLVFVYSAKPGLVAYADLSVTNSAVLERSNSSFIGGTPISLGHNCDPWAWLDSQSLICVETTAQGVTPETTIDLVTLGSGYKTGTTTSLLPGNTRDNADPVLSPDGSRVGFLSIQGQTTTLYETGVHANRTNPTRITAFPPTAPISYVIGWR